MKRSQQLDDCLYTLTGDPSDYDELMETIGNREVVLIGEATHGTEEFYRIRADITRRLILEKGFSAVAVEADWPDAYHVNCFVSGRKYHEPQAALGTFTRFPNWMWRNQAVADFMRWLRGYNEKSGQNCGFYGLDLYSMHRSAELVVEYLDKVDPQAAIRARERYRCFGTYKHDSTSYSYAVGLQMQSSCEKAVVEQLIELRQNAIDYILQDDPKAEEDFFNAEQNAELVKDAEHYYRTSFNNGTESWNIRDKHMLEVLRNLRWYTMRRNHSGKVVVWAHNSHIGDARATEMSKRGEWNLGQLARQEWGDNTYLIGFSSYTGTVTCSSGWGGLTERKILRPALSGSYELCFHRASRSNFLLMLQNDTLPSLLYEPHLQRAVGVIYRPETERLSHYYYSTLTRQFDAVLHIDVTTALEPLQMTQEWNKGETLVTA